jgi:hypothetical protein
MLEAATGFITAKLIEHWFGWMNIRPIEMHVYIMSFGVIEYTT